MDPDHENGGAPPNPPTPRVFWPKSPRKDPFWPENGKWEKMGARTGATERQ